MITYHKYSATTVYRYWSKCLSLCVGVGDDIAQVLGQAKVAMIEWLRCSTHIHKILCSNLGIFIHGMTVDKLLTARLSRMTHSRTMLIYHQLVRWTEGMQILPSVKRKGR